MCSGNYYRSRFAEIYFNWHAEHRGLPWRAESRGLALNDHNSGPLSRHTSARLAAQGVCAAGELVKHVVQAGVKAGHDSDLSTWAGEAIQLAVEETKVFEARARQRKTEQKVA